MLVLILKFVDMVVVACWWQWWCGVGVDIVVGVVDLVVVVCWWQ